MGVLNFEASADQLELSRNPHQRASTGNILADEIAALAALKVPTVMSAGNILDNSATADPGFGPSGGVQLNACVADAIAVGAIDDMGTNEPSVNIDTNNIFNNGQFRYFSTWAHQLLLDLWGPGSEVTTHDHVTGLTLQGWGTSFAAPHVAGVLTRLRARYPTETPSQLLARLQNVCPAETDLKRSPPAVYQKRVCWSAQWN